LVDYFDFTGKVVMVVGVGGFGCAQAVAFAERGADIVAADNRTEVAEEVAEKVKALGRKALAISVDVTDEQSVVDMVEKAVASFNHIDVLVNTAGTVVRGYTGLDMPIADWQRIIDVNARGTLLCCREVARQMIKQGGGRIINTSSVRGFYATENGGIGYCDSKAAVNLITKALACELAKHNIRVNALAPTVIKTDFVKQITEDPEAQKRLSKTIPLGRVGETEDIVGPTLFLASDASNYVTAHILMVDGGLTAKV